MSSLPSRAASQKGWVSVSGVGRSKRTPAMTGLAPGRERGGGLARDLHLTVLVEQLAVEVDEVGAVLLALVGDGDLGDERLPRPGLLGEPHLVLGEVADTHVVGDGPGKEAGREHAVAEYARQPGRLRLHLVVVHGVEVA